jgi:hypothetical protein
MLTIMQIMIMQSCCSSTNLFCSTNVPSYAWQVNFLAFSLVCIDRSGSGSERQRTGWLENSVFGLSLGPTDGWMDG